MKKAKQIAMLLVMAMTVAVFTACGYAETTLDAAFDIRVVNEHIGSKVYAFTVETNFNTGRALRLEHIKSTTDGKEVSVVDIKLPLNAGRNTLIFDTSWLQADDYRRFTVSVRGDIDEVTSFSFTEERMFTGLFEDAERSVGSFLGFAGSEALAQAGGIWAFVVFTNTEMFSPVSGGYGCLKGHDYFIDNFERYEIVTVLAFRLSVADSIYDFN